MEVLKNLLGRLGRKRNLLGRLGRKRFAFGEFLSRQHTDVHNIIDQAHSIFFSVTFLEHKKLSNQFCIETPYLKKCVKKCAPQIYLYKK